jgi:hypothetical protein
LNTKTIERIFNGDFGAKDIPVKLDEAGEKEKALHHAASVNESETCKSVRIKLIQVVGFIQYNAWFTKVSFTDTNGHIQFKAESPFIEAYIKQHFERFLLV